MMAVPIQKPPYDDSAVAPKVLPTAISLRKVSFRKENCVCIAIFYAPHACQQLDETTIRECSADHNVWLSETTSTQVDA